MEMNDIDKAKYNLIKYNYDMNKEPIYLKDGDIVRFRKR